MDKLLAVVQYILNMGPTVILPITIVVLGMIFRIKFTKALKVRSYNWYRICGYKLSCKPININTRASGSRNG